VALRRAVTRLAIGMGCTAGEVLPEGRMAVTTGFGADPGTGSRNLFDPVAPRGLLAGPARAGDDLAADKA
jgi:hypothetical protein